MISKKVAMLGMWGVGKTSLVRQFVHSSFDDKYLSTLGVKVDKKVVHLETQDVNLMLWDIAGAEDKFSVPMHYIKGAAAFLLVVDGTRQESLDSARDLVKKIELEIGDLPFVVAVNKSDLEWQITIDQVAATFKVDTFSTSAKTGENVELLFTRLAERLV